LRRPSAGSKPVQRTTPVRSTAPSPVVERAPTSPQRRSSTQKILILSSLHPFPVLRAVRQIRQNFPAFSYEATGRTPLTRRTQRSGCFATGIPARWRPAGRGRRSPSSLRHETAEGPSSVPSFYLCDFERGIRSYG
jgi:hypothetical protein